MIKSRPAALNCDSGRSCHKPLAVVVNLECRNGKPEVEIRAAWSRDLAGCLIKTYSF
jgi:hypothetical protein